MLIACVHMPTIDQKLRKFHLSASDGSVQRCSPFSRDIMDVDTGIEQQFCKVSAIRRPGFLVFDQIVQQRHAVIAYDVDVGAVLDEQRNDVIMIETRASGVLCWLRCCSAPSTTTERQLRLPVHGGRGWGAATFYAR
jgi:hypothetical protein